MVIFTCNHCPYALAWHDRLMEVARDYDGTCTSCAINPNDAERYPRDSFEAMKERVAARRRAGRCRTCTTRRRRSRARTAPRPRPTCSCSTPTGALRYRGAPDADHEDDGTARGWLREALDAMLAGEEPARPETEPVGCSVKWRQ